MQNEPAGGAPLERRVRPRAWALPIADMAGGGDYLRSKLSSDSVELWEPLYDQAAFDAAIEQANARQNAAWQLMCEKMVAAERERWADAMRAIMSSPVGMHARDKLAAGQGTDTPGGRAWLAALRMLDLGPNTEAQRAA